MYDVKNFFSQYEFTEKLKKAFIVYLISGNRQLHEMIQPNLLNQRKLFEEQFLGMTEDIVSYEELENARLQLIKTINQNLDLNEREFLISFKKGEPIWDLIGIADIDQLPGVRWKLMNIKKMPTEKHRVALYELEQLLNQ